MPVKIYKPGELDRAHLAHCAVEILGKKPFNWQLDAAEAVLCGQDVVLDVGTGSGKTLCFSLPLLLHKTDMALTISPLTALMLDQVCDEGQSQVEGNSQCSERQITRA